MIAFPGESGEYRAARDRLLDQEIRLRREMEAVAETEGPEPALAIVERLDLGEYRYLHATRAELLRRLGRTGESRDAYARAIELAHDAAERRLLERRLAQVR